MGKNDSLYLEEAARIQRTDIRLPIPALVQILQKWEASHKPTVPLLPSSSASSASNSPVGIPKHREMFDIYSERTSSAVRLLPSDSSIQDLSTGALESPNGDKRQNGPDEGNASRLKLREQQILAIEAAIGRLSFPPMCIPKGGKKTVETECRNANGYASLFGGGPDPFKAAWQEAVNQKRVRTAGHTGYASR